MKAVKSSEMQAKYNLAQNIVESFVQQMKGASSLEEVLVLESKAIASINDMDREIELELVSPGHNVYYSDFEYWRDLRDRIISLLTLASSTLELMLSLGARLDSKYILFNNLSDSIKQKVAWLDYLSDGESKFSLIENFNSIIGSNLEKNNTISFNNSVGVGTLPIISESLVKVQKIALGASSNGRTGRSDEPGNTSNISLNNILVKDDYFEYELSAPGEMILELEFSFANSEIINCLDLYPFISDRFKGFDIKDILFSTKGSTISIFALCPVNSLHVSEADSRYRIVFLPIETKTVSIIFSQKAETLSGINNHYSNITIDRIDFLRLSFDKSGQYNSIDYTIPENLFLVEDNLKAFPRNKDMFLFESSITVDQKQTFSFAEPVILPEDASVVSFSFKIEKDYTALNKHSSFFDNLIVQKVDVFSSPFNYLLLPSKVKLPAKFSNSEYYCYHPQIAKVSEFDSLYLGQLNIGANKIKSPIKLNKTDIENIHVYVNDIEQSFVETGPIAGEWTLSDDYRFIEFGVFAEEKKRISLRIDPEFCKFTYSNGYYYYIPLYKFDPDKEILRLSYLSSDKSTALITLPQDKKVIDLGFSKLYSISLFSSNGTVYTEVFDKASLATETYYVDYANGTVWLYEEFDTDLVRASISYYESKVLENNDYEVIFDNEHRAESIRIIADNISAITHTDTVGVSVSDTLDISSGKPNTRYDPLSGSRAKTLSYRNILPNSLYVTGLLDSSYDTLVEVSFIDGNSEFLGLNYIDDEKTNEVVPAGNIATFSLSGGENTYLSYGVYFSNTTIFNEKVGSLAAVTSAGKYYIDTDGTVSVWIDSGNLPADIEINYYYRDPEFKPENKYSVNYQEGIIYSGSDMQNGGLITYKTAQYAIEYDIVIPVKILDKNVKDKIATIKSPHNYKLVKFACNNKSTDTSLAKYSDYYSPILDSYSLRFY